MNEVIDFVEEQLDCACRHRNDYRLINSFKHNAYGACVFMSGVLIRDGKIEEARQLDDLWDNKYRIHFEALESKAS